MRKLAVMGAVAAVALATATGARAATQTYNISGNLANSMNSCFNIAVSLTGTDCSYARTRVPQLPTPSGPKFTAGFYSKGSLGDNVNQVPASGDGKSELQVTGTVTIDDGDTPNDGTDDLISASWVIAAGVHNAATGSGDRALERWDSWTHEMAPTPVNWATANGGGGFTYVIGSRQNIANGVTNGPTGLPTPAPLCAAANPSDCFPTENAPDTQAAPGFWDQTFSVPGPASARIGIERTPAFGLYPANPGPSPNPNVGAQTTGAFTGYECIDNAGDNDCISSETLLGSDNIFYRTESGTPAPAPVGGTYPGPGNCTDGIDNDGTGGTDAADPECQPIAPSQLTGQSGAPISPPGFENVILQLVTDGQGAITSAQAFWTREYVILSGPSAGTDAAGVYSINNSYGGGRILFTGTLPQDSPTAVDDSANVIEDTATSIAVLANDTRGAPEPNTVTIESQPANGSVSVNGENVVYTPDQYFSGNDSFQYRVTDADGGTDFSIATVTVTVSEKTPDARNFNASSSGGNPTAAIPVLVAPTVLGTGPAAEHVVAVTGVATGGTCAVSGSGASQAVTFTPTPGFNGVGSCEFSVTDADGQSDNAQLNVSVSGNSSGGGGGVSGPQLPSGGSSLDLLTLALLAGAPLVARRRRVAR